MKSSRFASLVSSTVSSRVSTCHAALALLLLVGATGCAASGAGEIAQPAAGSSVTGAPAAAPAAAAQDEPWQEIPPDSSQVIVWVGGGRAETSTEYTLNLATGHLSDARTERAFAGDAPAGFVTNYNQGRLLSSSELAAVRSSFHSITFATGRSYCSSQVDGNDIKVTFRSPSVGDVVMSDCPAEGEQAYSVYDVFKAMSSLTKSATK